MNPVLSPAEQEDDVQHILNQQREESEAIEIVRDVSNQHSLAPEKKGRWIWEVLQNARDVAQEDATGKRSVVVNLHLQ